MMNAAEQPAPVRLSAGTRRALDWVQRLFTPVALLFLAYVGWRSHAVLAQVFAQARPSWLALSVGLWAVLNAMAPYVSTRILAACGADLDYATAFRVYARRLPGRYVPGGIWHAVGRTVDFYRHGVAPRHLAALVLVEGVLPPAVAFILGGIGMALLAVQPGAWSAAAVASAAVAAAALAALPSLVRRRIVKGQNILSWRHYAGITFWYAAYWLVAAAAFLCYLAGFPAVTPSSWAGMGSAYLFAWGVGNVAVFAPQGIGVFEVVAGRLVAASMSLGGAAVLMAGFRVVGLAADVLVWALSYRQGTARRA